MPELKYDIPAIDVCPCCGKQPTNNIVHDKDIVLSIDCNKCNLSMKNTITGNKSGLAISFISGIAHEYAALVRRWNFRSN